MLAPSPAYSEDTAFPVEDVPLADIHAGNRLRPVDPAWAEAMATAIEAGARVPPITVRRPDRHEGIEQPFALVIGGHRYEAFRLLGRAQIRAEIADYDAVRARLAEVQENLIRSELTALDRAVFIAEHRRIWDILHPEAGRGGDRRSKEAINRQSLPIGQRRFSDDVAARCGLGERTIRDALRIAEQLAPEAISLLRGTDWARNASELQRLAAETAECQVEFAALHARGEAASVLAAKIATGKAATGEGDPQQILLERTLANWNRLDAKRQQSFLDLAGLTVKEGTRKRRSKTSGHGGEA
ncbi:ParB/RepB/Spo0J family partition protein [Methylorubrum extorquens]|uniref:ParB/RepB/Spo0J family partition protein n=1 Tax=Methylorubrum extorquens TaxID=408 RepID=UPI003F6133E4